MPKIQHKRMDSNSDFFEWYESLKNNNKMVADRLEMISYSAMLVYYINNDVCHYSFVMQLDIKKNKKK